MPGRIPENILEDVLSKIDIVEVISGFMPLKRAGRNFKTNCPFHHEKTPSFIVSPDRQIYHCFGCGESGNAFKFLMRYERLEFPEAVEALAKKAGVILPVAQNNDFRVSSGNLELYTVNELAVAYYADNLWSPAGAGARKYLASRGISEEIMKSFKLGLAFEKWDGLITYLRGKNYSLSTIEKAGLILKRDSGGYFDRFRSRVLFPILDVKSRTLGFGGRIMENAIKDQAKYVNSCETPIYTKGKNLYGLALTKDHIRDTDCVVIVEGYLDFIIPYQNGIRNIVASLGTALTIEQVRLLKRYAASAVMVYDPDDAGQMATLRSLDILIEEEMQVRIVSLPKGYDPDLFVRKYGAIAFREKIATAMSLFDYKLGVLIGLYKDKSIEGRSKIATLMLETVNKIKNSVLKSEYMRKLARELDVKEEALLEQARKTKTSDTARGAMDSVPEKRALAINPTEKLLLRLMLEETALIARIQECIEPGDFRNELASRIVSMLFDLSRQGKSIDPKSLMNQFDNDDVSRVIGESLCVPEDLSSRDKEEIVVDCIQRLKTERVKLRRTELHNEIKAAQDSGDIRKIEELMLEFQSLIRKG